LNFFEAQDKAHRRTGFLIGMLTAGLIAMTVGLYFVVMLTVHLVGGWTAMEESRAAKDGGRYRPDAIERWAEIELGTWWSIDVLLVTFGIMLLLVGGGFLFRYLQLRRGGQAVAEMMGGVRLLPDTSDSQQRRALNVVEEMSIASGVPVPPVYEIPDDSINAFAAGHTVDQAAIGLTRGCIALPREELQGVVAHEFSHIFNGDMRLNLRLIAVINGVMVLGITGLLMARYVGWSILMSGGGRRSSNDKGSGLMIAVGIIVLGWMIAAIGFMGTLVARIIQAAISRQREFLADASAVQFTRNPDGIAGALTRIAKRPMKTRIAGEASQFNHMFFSQAVPALFATHPPLDLRISRITGGRAIDVSPLAEKDAPEESASTDSPMSGLAATAVAIGHVHQAIASAGDINNAPVDWTRQMIASIPLVLRDAAHTPQAARALIAAMLIEDSPKDDEVVSRQQEAIQRLLPPHEATRVEDLAPSVAKLDAAARIPLLDLTSAAVQSLSPSQSQELRTLVEALVAADRKVSRFEWVVALIVDAMLDRGGEPSHSARRTINSMTSSVWSILSVVAFAGGMDEQEVNAAVQAACDQLGMKVKDKDASGVSLTALGEAVHDLRSLKFSERRRLLEAVVSIVDHDGQTTIAEAEIVRAVAEVLAVPMPPIVPDSALG